VFAERGYEGGSMRTIAERVGVTEPALYRHFPGKEALFLAIIKVAAARLRTEAMGLIGSASPADLCDQLVAAFRDRRRAMATYGPALRTILASATHNPAFMDAYREAIVLPLQAALTAKTRELDEAFCLSFTEEETEVRVRTLMALFVGYFITSVMLGDERDEAVADAVLRVMGWPS